MESCEHGNAFHCPLCEIKYMGYVIEDLKEVIKMYEELVEMTLEALEEKQDIEKLHSELAFSFGVIQRFYHTKK